jgi:hypothetical protein
MIALARSASAEEVVLLHLSETNTTTTNTSAGATITTTTAATAEQADRGGSVSPGGTTTQKVEGPADIPSQKLAFGEDKRALKALDKVFI